MANTNPVILAQRLQLSHKQRVLKLYRDSLKHLLSWTGSRLIWREQAVLLRERFDANKHLTDRSQIQKVLEEGEKLFNENRHPQPYICNLLNSKCSIRKQMGKKYTSTSKCPRDVARGRRMV
ncbi:NADH dehydrogenase [ubiquinone] 1 beta subcomplex subunit 9 isoform X2 [Hydra vulgaris]|uniref:NADH dehydrogenase [ubiquinone] 1 beta subcomplex subunit 9 isoform X2 n=1 Tax=Hydra vulgaris TaxID=6087 RepID=UPI001F5F929D|nr:NADH dehydrogenase [ubiquinone] 1 beta subcomplex subunit 9-like isoform X2 [Hydra vulgaris]